MLSNNLRYRITEDMEDYERWIKLIKSRIEILIKDREKEITKINQCDYPDDVRITAIDSTCNQYDEDINDLEWQLHYNEFRALINQMAVSWLDEHAEFAEKISESDIYF